MKWLGLWRITENERIPVLLQLVPIVNKITLSGTIFNPIHTQHITLIKWPKCQEALRPILVIKGVGNQLGGRRGVGIVSQAVMN